MRTDRPRTAVRAFAVFLLFTLLAGDFWRNTISWGGWIALALALAVVSGILLVRLRPSIPWSRLPWTLGLFLAWATVSLIWSDYRGASVLGILGQYATTLAALFLALCLSWEELLRALGHALRWIIGLSILFELVVSVIIRHEIVPLWTNYGPRKIPQAFYWSRDLLFHGGQIQGIQGNSNLLAMIALLGLIVFSIELGNRSVRQVTGIVWIVLAVATFALTRSSTIFAATAFTIVVALFALWMRASRSERRLPIYGAMLAVGILGVLAIWRLQGPILHLLDKSDSLTGRTGIWGAVIHLAQERPVTGWGWVSYWAPWVPLFQHLAVRKGVTYLQAHDAWLDVWMQLGIIGLVIFILLVATTLWRSWFAAIDRPRTRVEGPERFTALTLLPLLVMAALVAQSAAESRILIEGGWALLVVMSVKTKAERFSAVSDPVPSRY